MYIPLSDKLKLRAEHKTVLKNLVIDAHQPGTLLHDFEALLHFFRERERTLTAACQLPLRILSDINERLANPVQLALKRPQQKSYPPIHGLYLLLRASGLTYVDNRRAKPTLIIDPAVYQSWIGLNPTEQYGTLLEAWLLRGKPEILNERGSSLWIIPDNFTHIVWFYTHIPPEGLVVAGNREVESNLLYSPGWYNLGLMALFGLIDIQTGTPEPGQGWRIERISRTPIGDALLALLYSEFFEASELFFELEDQGRVPSGLFQPLLQPYKPTWKNNLAIPEWAFRAGEYRFKVALGPFWSRIAIGGESLLDSLSALILNAVQFDQDHLYQFSFSTRFGFTQNVNHPALEEAPFTDETRVGDLPLRVGQSMIYLYDFGDQWEFDVTLEAVDPAQPNARPRVLETHGEPPEQYPGSEDGAFLMLDGDSLVWFDGYDMNEDFDEEEDSEE